MALESVYGCMSCYDCKKGNYNICEDVKVCGTPKVWGSMCRYFVHRASDCYKYVFENIVSVSAMHNNSLKNHESAC